MPLGNKYYDAFGNPLDYNQYSGLDAAIDNMQGGMYTGLEGAAKYSGLGSAEKYAADQAKRNYDEARQYIPTGPQRIEDIDGVGSAVDYVKELAISQAPILGTMAGGAIAGGLLAGPAGAIAGGALASTPMHMGEAYTKQKQTGEYGVEKFIAATAANVAMEAIPAATAVNAVRRMGGGTLARAVGKNILAESSTEAAQGVTTDWAANITPENDPGYWMNRANEAVAGGIMGGVAGGLGHVASYPAQAAQLPGEAYDSIQQGAQGLYDKVRPMNDEEAAAAEAANAEERRKYGAVGKSEDLTESSVRMNLRDGIELTDDQILWLNQFDDTELARIMDTEAGQEEQTAPYATRNQEEEDWIDTLDGYAEKLANQTQTAEDEFEISKLTEDERNYVDLKADQMEFGEFRDDTVVDEEGEAVEGEADAGQFLDFTDDEGGKSDRPDANIEDGATRARSIHYKGTKDINPKTKQPWDPDDYMMNPDAVAPYRKNAHTADAKKKRDDRLKELNKSGMRTYKQVGLNEAVEAEVIRKWFNDENDQAKSDNVDKFVAHRLAKIDERLAQATKSGKQATNKNVVNLLKRARVAVANNNYDVDNRVLDILKGIYIEPDVTDKTVAARKKQVAADILASRKNKNNALFAEMQRRNDSSPAELLDLFDAIEVSDKEQGLQTNYEAFDLEDKENLHVKVKRSPNPKEDTSRMDMGFVPLADGKMLNLPKAVNRRMRQFKAGGETKLDLRNMDEVEKSEELDTLRRRAITSVMAEYEDSMLGRELFTLKETIESLPQTKDTVANAADSWMLQKEIKDIKSETIEAARIPNSKLLGEGIEIPRNDSHTADNGFIPLRSNMKRHNKVEHVLVVDKAISAIKANPAFEGKSDRELMSTLLAIYKDDIGGGKQLTQEDVVNRASATLSWNEGDMVDGEFVRGYKTGKTPREYMQLTTTSKARVAAEDSEEAVNKQSNEKERLDAAQGDPALNTFMPSAILGFDPKNPKDVALQKRWENLDQPSRDRLKVQYGKAKRKNVLELRRAMDKLQNDAGALDSLQTPINKGQTLAVAVQRARSKVASVINKDDKFKVWKELQLGLGTNVRPYTASQKADLASWGISPQMIAAEKYEFADLEKTINRQMKTELSTQNLPDASDYDIVAAEIAYAINNKDVEHAKRLGIYPVKNAPTLSETEVNKLVEMGIDGETVYYSNYTYEGIRKAVNQQIMNRDRSFAEEKDEVQDEITGLPEEETGVTPMMDNYPDNKLASPAVGETGMTTKGPRESIQENPKQAELFPDDKERIKTPAEADRKATPAGDTPKADGKPAVKEKAAPSPGIVENKQILEQIEYHKDTLRISRDTLSKLPIREAVPVKNKTGDMEYHNLNEIEKDWAEALDAFEEDVATRNIRRRISVTRGLLKKDPNNKGGKRAQREKFIEKQLGILARKKDEKLGGFERFVKLVQNKLHNTPEYQKAFRDNKTRRAEAQSLIASLDKQIDRNTPEAKAARALQASLDRKQESREAKISEMEAEDKAKKDKRKFRGKTSTLAPKKLKIPSNVGETPIRGVKYELKKNGALVRDYTHDGLPVPLAYVIQMDSLDSVLMVHKEQGTNKWTVTSPELNDPLIGRFDSRKEAAQAIRDEDVQVLSDQIDNLLEIQSGVQAVDKKAKRVAQVRADKAKALTAAAEADAAANRKLDSRVRSAKKRIAGITGSKTGLSILNEDAVAGAKGYQNRTDYTAAYARAVYQKNPTVKLVFGDNLMLRGKLGNAIIRDERNAYGIPTRRYASERVDAKFSDKPAEIAAVQKALDGLKGQNFIIPRDGVMFDVRNMYVRSPKIAKMITKFFQENVANFNSPKMPTDPDPKGPSALPTSKNKEEKAKIKPTQENQPERIKAVLKDAGIYPGTYKIYSNTESHMFWAQDRLGAVSDRVRRARNAPRKLSAEDKKWAQDRHDEIAEYKKDMAKLEKDFPKMKEAHIAIRKIYAEMYPDSKSGDSMLSSKRPAKSIRSSYIRDIPAMSDKDIAKDIRVKNWKLKQPWFTKEGDSELAGLIGEEIRALETEQKKRKTSTKDNSALLGESDETIVEDITSYVEQGEQDLNKTLKAFIDDKPLSYYRPLARRLRQIIPEGAVNTYMTDTAPGEVLSLMRSMQGQQSLRPTKSDDAQAKGSYAFVDHAITKELIEEDSSSNPFEKYIYDTVMLNSVPGSLDYGTLVHEALHAAVSRIYKRADVDPMSVPLEARQATRELKKLYKKFIDYTDDNIDKIFDKYGIGAIQRVRAPAADINEFITYALTDEDTQNILKDIEYEHTPLWNKFVEAVTKLLGLHNNDQNVLGAMITVVDKLLTSASIDRETRLEKMRFKVQEVRKLGKEIEAFKRDPKRTPEEIQDADKAIQRFKKSEEKLVLYGKLTKKHNLSKSDAKAELGELQALQSIQDKANAMVKGMGFNINIVDMKRATQLAKDLGIEDFEVNVRYGSLHGFADATPNVDGSFNVFVNPNLTGKLADEILAHEVGHITMYGSGLDKNTTRAEAQGVLREFKTWMDKFGKDTTKYEEIIKSKKTPEAALIYLKSGLGEYKMGDLSPDMQAYIRDFDEWYADNAGKALLNKLKGIKPTSVVQKYFNKLIEALKRVFGTETEVAKYLRRLENPVTHESAPGYKEAVTFVQGKLRGAVRKSMTSMNKKYSESAWDKFRDIVLDKDMQLRKMAEDTGVAAFQELAELFHKKRGTKGVDKSYWHAKLHHMAKYDEHVTSIMRGASKDQQNEIMAQLYQEGLPDRAVLPRTRKIRALFKDLYSYLKEAGVDVKARKNYFPEIADVEYVEKNKDEFLDMMARYPKEMKGIAEKWNTDLKKKNHHLRKVTKPEDLLTMADVPLALYENIVKTDGVFDDTPPTQQTPSVRFTNHRIISFLQGADKQNWLANYLQSSVTDATSSYILSAVKRAEYEKRFGSLNKAEQAQWVIDEQHKTGRTTFTADEMTTFFKAAEATNRFEVLMDKAYTQGATPEQVTKARNYLAAEMGTYGRDTAVWLNEHFGLPMPPAYSPINKGAQTASSTIMSIANVWVLGMSTLTSLADPVGIAVRTGSMTAAFDAMKEGIKASISNDRTELEALSEAVGAISDIATKEALAHGYNMAYMTPKVRQMNDWFFRKIGLEQWTKTTRIMAVSAAQSFLKRHDKKPNKHSKRFLEELGLKRGDIKYGADGKVVVLGYEQYKTATKAEQESDDRLKSALSEFVDTAILRPNPSSRPLWASDPHLALLFHLKSFAYSFQKTILNPLVHEAKNGNYMPLLMVGGYIPTMIMVGMMKDILKTVGDEDDDFTPDFKDKWTAMDYIFDGVEKGGLYGIAQPIFDVARDRRYGGSGFGALYSPGLDPDTFNRLPVPFNYVSTNLSN